MIYPTFFVIFFGPEMRYFFQKDNTLAKSQGDKFCELNNMLYLRRIPKIISPRPLTK